MPSGKKPLPSALSVQVGRLLKAAIDGRAGLTQKQVAMASGVSESQVSRGLAGIKVLTLDELDAICDALSIDLADIIADAEALVRPGLRPRRLKREHLSLVASDYDDWQRRQEKENE